MSLSKPFHIVHLPNLPIQLIMEFWCPLELYTFSTLCKKTASVAKYNMKSIKVLMDIQLIYRIEIIIYDPSKTKKWSFYFEPSYLENFRSLFKRTEKILEVSEKDFVARGITCLRRLLELYRVTIDNIDLAKSRHYTAETFREVVQMLNEHKQESAVRELTLRCLKKHTPIIIDNYQKNTDSYNVKSSWERHCSFPKNLEIQKLNIRRAYPGLKFFLSMNCSIANFHYSSLSNKDLNRFLKSWAAGESNGRLKEFRTGMKVKMNLLEVLKGLSPRIRSLMDTKRKIDNSWLHGGIDIERIDGKIATICELCFVSKTEHRPIPQRIVQKYEEAMTWNWNSREDVADEKFEGNRRFWIVFW